MRRASVALLLLLAAFACTRAGGGVVPGDVAPDFRGADLTGRTVYFNAELTTPVVLTFFATWCVPCREEMPLLVDFQRRHAGGAKVLCVLADPENREQARRLADAVGATYPFLLDERGDIQRAYGVRELPATFLIDTTGRVRSRFAAFSETEALALENDLKRLALETP